MTTITQDDIDRCKTALTACKGNSTAAAASLGMPETSFRRRVKHVSVPSKPAPEVDQATQFDKRLVSLQDENHRLRAELRSTVRHNLTASRVREEVFGLKGLAIDVPDWTVKMPSNPGAGPGIPVVFFSDWHWAEVVKPQEVGGRNEFNLPIAHERARRATSLACKLAFKHQVHKGYPGIVLILGGDMVTGEIHEELADTNELKTLPSVVDMVGVLTRCIRELKEKFGRVFIPCVVGNHGRTTHKPRHKTVVHTSYDWLTYVMLEAAFKDDPAVRFFIPEDIDAHFVVANTRFMLTHGDRIGSGGGDGFIGAIGPIMRGRGKIAISERQVGHDFDVLLMGHWHTYMPLSEIGLIVNGSLKGYDEYARSKLRAPFQRPIQAMWYVHPTVGITKHEPLYLDGGLLPPANEDQSWIRWAA